MSNPTIRIHDLVTNEVTDREMTVEEFSAYKVEQNENAKRLTEQQARIAAKSALLERLGITAEEAALLLG